MRVEPWREDTGEDSPPETRGASPNAGPTGGSQKGPENTHHPPARAPVCLAHSQEDWLQVPSRSVTATMAPRLPTACCSTDRCLFLPQCPTHICLEPGRRAGAHTGSQTSGPPRLTEPDAQRTPVPTWRPSVPFGATSLSPQFSWAPPESHRTRSDGGPGVHSSTGWQVPGQNLGSDHHNHTQPCHSQRLCLKSTSPKKPREDRERRRLRREPPERPTLPALRSWIPTLYL